MLTYFKDVGITSRLKEKSAKIEGMMHLVDFLRILHSPSTSGTESEESSIFDE